MRVVRSLVANYTITCLTVVLSTDRRGGERKGHTVISVSGCFLEMFSYALPLGFVSGSHPIFMLFNLFINPIFKA